MPHMGLTTWKKAPDGRVQKSDTIVAKNYLSDEELSQLINTKKEEKTARFLQKTNNFDSNSKFSLQKHH